MKILYFSLIVLIFYSCLQSAENSAEPPEEESFRAPENPFRSNSEQSEPDSSKKAKKAEKPGMIPAKIDFDKKVIRFDSISSGNIFKAELSFTNSGEQPLEITLVRSSQKAEMSWSKLLIAASEKSSIVYKIKMPDKKAMYTDSIFILSNAGQDTVLLKGQIR